MLGRIPRVAVTLAAVTCAGLGAAVLASAAPGAGPETATTEPASPETTEGPTTSTISRFPNGETARRAAESLIGPYIQSQFATTVGDIACSVPDSGEVGQGFTCYALKPDDLVIALRASIAEGRLIELELLLNQTERATPETTEPAG